MPLSGTSTALQDRNVGSEANSVPLCALHHEGVQVSVKNTFIEVGPKRPPPFKRSVTVETPGTPAASSSDVSGNLQLPLTPANAIDAPEIPATPSMGTWPRSPMDAYFDPCPLQSPMSRWFDGLPSDHCEVSDCHAEGASPLARWLRGSPRADEACHADALQKQGAFAMRPEAPVVGPMYFAPFGQPMMWQTAPTMTSAMCPPASMAQTTVQPTSVLVPQQALAVWPQQLNPQTSSNDAAASTTAPATTKSGIWEGMAAWKAQQSSLDDKRKISMGRIPENNWKATKSQFSTSNQNAVRSKGKNATSKKPVETSDNVALGPRAVFVDLSKIIPTGVLA